MAHEKLEVNASQNDRDFIVALNWKAAAAVGEGELVDDVRLLDPRTVEGLVYLIPVAKSPHGADVDPSGKYIHRLGLARLADHRLPSAGP